MENDKIRVETRIGDRPFTVEGTKQIVLETLRELEKEYGVKTNIYSGTTEITAHTPKPPKSKTKQSLEVPTVEQIMDYVFKKENYEHDTLEIEDVFWGKRVTARENETLYRKIYGNITMARHRIETIKHGKFEPHLTKAKNLKTYVFKPITQTLIGTLNGKTSPPS